LRGTTPGPKLTTRKTLPLAIAVGIFLFDGSSLPSLFTGSSSVDQITL